MNLFSHNDTPQAQSVEEILHYHKKRLFKQQLAFTCIFILLLMIGAIYLYRRVVYTYYDGYIKLDQNHIRAIDDMFILEIHKKMGDEVHYGDTLFSYVLIDNILGQQNVNTLPGIVSDLHRMQAQADLARTEVPVLKVRLQELARRLKNEEHDVYYGLNDNTHKLLLEAEKREVEARLREQYRKISLYQKMADKASGFIHSSGYDSNFMPYSPNDSIVGDRLIKYVCAPQDAIVTDIKVSEETVVFHQEKIVDLQPHDYASCNLGVMAYIPSNKVKYINRKGNVEIIVNDDITLKARLSLIGIRVEEIPRHLLSNFSHDVDAVVAYFTFLPGQQVPFWVFTNNLPIRVRTNNFQPEDEEFASRILEIKENNEVVPLKTEKTKKQNSK